MLSMERKTGRKEEARKKRGPPKWPLPTAKSTIVKRSLAALGALPKALKPSLMGSRAYHYRAALGKNILSATYYTILYVTGD